MNIGKKVRGPFPPLVLGGFAPCPDCGQNITTKVSEVYTQGADCPLCWRPLPLAVVGDSIAGETWHSRIYFGKTK